MANGTLKVQNIETSSGSGTITLGQSGETIALGSGVTSKLNQPAFEADVGSTQNLTNDTNTKAQCDIEVFDTDNCYDNSTNYRFTPNKAGRYLVYGAVRGGPNSGLTACDKVTALVYKNGSVYDNKNWRIDFRNNQGSAATVSFTTVIEMNGTTDYLELYGNVDVTSGTAVFYSNTTFFGAYRLGVE